MNRLIILVHFFSFCSIAQLEVYSSFPSILNETSGLEYSCGSIFSHNDSGDTTRVFRMNSSGVLEEEIYLVGAKHLDWEDLAFNSKHQLLYVGDLGSNNYLFERPERVLYKLGLSSSYEVENKISFEFEDYTEFEDHSNFDCEAFIYLNDKIYLFTKNHGSSGYSKIYELLPETGNQTARLIDSLYTKNAVTAADSYLNQVALLTEFEVFLLHYENGQFSFSSTHGIPHRQYEGICYLDKNQLLISSENSGNQLFSLTINSADFDPEHIYVPTEDQVAIDIPEELGQVNKICLYSSNGQMVKDLETGHCETDVLLNVSDLASGAYIVLLQGTTGTESKRIVIP